MKKDKKKNYDALKHSEDVPKNTKATVKRLFGYMAKQKGKLFIVIATALASSIAYGLMPLMVGRGIDNLLTAIKGYDGSISVWSAVANALGTPVMLLAAAAVICCLLSYIQQYVIASVGENLTLAMRQEISQKINKLPLRYFDSHKAGDVMSRVTNDLEKVSMVMQVGLMQFISACFTIVITCVAMIMLSPKLFVLVVISMVVSMIATGFVSSLSQRYYAQNMKAMGALSAKVEELYTGNKVIKVFNQQESSIKAVEELNQNQYEANRKAQFADYAIYPSIRLINQLGFIVTAIVGGIMALNGYITLGGIQAFLQYVNQVSEPITQASYVITSLQAAIAGAERVFEMLDEPEENADTIAQVFAPPTGSVRFKNVKFGYTPDRMLMENVNLEVKPNEMVAIVGPTGGGKTTLINLLMRFYEVNGGNITIDGVDITSLSRNKLRRKIGMVLQDTWLFEGTIAENIAYGKQNATREEIVAAAKSACCDHFIRTLPEGYDTMISGESSSISQGQMQLLTIARAMLTNPSIMILDEATSSVDTRTESQIQKAMTRLMENKTSFVIAHRLSTIQNADMILVVKDGDIVERGNHETLLAKNGFYASLYNSQFMASVAR